MSKVLKIFSIALVVTMILIVAIAGAAFADNPERGAQNKNQTGDCICDGDCTPTEHFYNYNYSGTTKGPHGMQYGKVVTE